MSALGDLLRARAARNPSVPIIHGARTPVGGSGDLERILALPRRPPMPYHPPEFEDSLKLPGCQMSLRPLQGWALWELSQHGGIVLAGPVGSGKSGTLLLAATVLGVQTTVLIVPPGLDIQLMERDVPLWSKNWKIQNVVRGPKKPPGGKPVIHVITSEELSQSKNVDLLDCVKPDLMLCDESHQFRFSKLPLSNRSMCLRRWFESAPQTKYVPSSGTFIDGSTVDFRHHVLFALKAGAPVPHSYAVAEQWALALDPLPKNIPPGQLTKLCAPGETVRQAFRRRLVETPGVISSAENVVKCSLNFYERRVTTPKSVLAALEALRRTWMTPDGEEFDSVLAFSRYARQLAAGLWYRRIWPNGESKDLQEEWLEARNAWAREVRTYLSKNPLGKMTPELLERAAESGQWKSKTWARWSSVRELAKPSTETVWIDDFMVLDAIKWAKDGGIIWYQHDGLGERIAELSGFEHIAGGDKDTRRLLRLIKSNFRDPMILSIPARHTGTDGLQRIYHRQLFTYISSGGKRNEQLLGRLHREGQTHDEVDCHVYLHTPENRAALKRAIQRAKFLEETTLASRQKLTYASFAFTL